MDDFESHSGAETMPVHGMALAFVGQCRRDALAVLVEYVEALLDKQRSVQYDQAIADGQDIVARPSLEEGAYGPLAQCQCSVFSVECRCRRLCVAAICIIPYLPGLQSVLCQA